METDGIQDAPDPRAARSGVCGLRSPRAELALFYTVVVAIALVAVAVLVLVGVLFLAALGAVIWRGREQIADGARREYDHPDAGSDAALWGRVGAAPRGRDGGCAGGHRAHRATLGGATPVAFVGARVDVAAV